jgi:catechol 2,3-dioxygenase-like lactoylglutathione lyase family enzyme
VIHHVVLETNDLERSAAFYDALLAPLGWRRHYDKEGIIGWGIAKPAFYVATRNEPRPGFGLISFPANGIAAVKAAWEAGQRAGGTGTREPGAIRSPASGSYSTFLKDPDGYDIEVTVGSP